MVTNGIRVDVSRAARILMEAEQAGEPCEQLTKTWPGLDVASAYEIQNELLSRRIERGEKVIGIKLGLTSRAKQVQMGVSTSTTAWLTDAMIHRGGPLPKRLIHPRAEPEIVLTLGKKLAGPGVKLEDALAAIASVRAGIEILDSRYLGFRFTLADVIADNNSSGRVILGEVIVPGEELDLAAEQCILMVNGKQVASANGAAVLGHPAAALAWAANEIGSRGGALEPGWIVMTGGMTDAMTMEPGAHVEAVFTHLGEVTAFRGG